MHVFPPAVSVPAHVLQLAVAVQILHYLSAFPVETASVGMNSPSGQAATHAL